MPSNMIQDPTKEFIDTPIVGIDFGTTHSLIARGSPPCIISDSTGPISLPTTVSYTDKGYTFGQEMHSIHSVKRLLGQSFSDIQHLNLPNVCEGAGNTILMRSDNRTHTPESLATEFFKHLYERTASHLGPHLRAVITVPAYFSEKARYAIRKCAISAGWHPFKILSEPTAAAFAYHLEKQPGCYLVYDWGGGTFDVSLLSTENGAFHILALHGDPLLGGDDIDTALAQKVLGSTLLSSEALLYAKKIKETLAHQDSIHWSFRTSCTLTSADLEEVFTPFIRKTLMLCDAALQDASCAITDITGVILAGGTASTPCVQKALQAHMRAPIYNSVNPQTVVAIGAATFAHNLQEGAEHALLDILPLSLGIETQGGLTDTIIPRNTPIPYTATQTFTTSVHNQKTVVLSVLQGERELASHCISLGTILVGPLPPLPAGVPRIEVSFLIDADGLLTVHAIETNSGVCSFSFLHDILDTKDKERIIRESSENALKDAEEVRRRSLTHTIQTLCHKVRTLHQKSPISESFLDEMSLIEALIQTDCGVHQIEQALISFEKSIVSLLDK